MTHWVLLCLEAAACDPGGPTLRVMPSFLPVPGLEQRNTLIH
jgi:hypothetical protein